MSTTPLKCIVVDDEPLACQLLASYVERCPSLKLVAYFTSAAKALEAIISETPDLVFLDIQMPEMSGLDLARQISDATKVVFTTAYDNYAVEGFKVNALHYLLKPISYEEFKEAVARALPRKKETSGFLNVKSDYRLVRIDISDIIYIEGLKDYIKIYLNSQPRPVITLMSLKAALAALPDDDFMRVHRSFIVNINKISALHQGKIIINNTHIPVSDSFRSSLLERL